MSDDPDHIAAHRHSSCHRDAILASDLCGCFHCRSLFAPTAIVEWVDDDDDGLGQTAMCPKCGVDSVVGTTSGYPITPEFLATMKRRWFG